MHTQKWSQPPTSASKSLSEGTRKPHTKRKTGCALCKKRRVQCDEAKPACYNCTRLNLQCPFLAECAADPAEAYRLIKRLASRRPPRRGRPTKNWDIVLNETGSTTKLLSKPAMTQDRERVSTERFKRGVTISLVNLTRTDVFLLEHFQTETYQSLAEASPVRSMWQDTIPQFALSIPESENSVLKLLLALSAFHLASVNHAASDREDYAGAGQSHFTDGVAILSGLVPSFTKDQRLDQVIFLSSILVCYCTLARGPQQGQYLVFGTEGAAEWLPLLAGLRQIRHLAGTSLFTGPLAAMNSGCDIHGSNMKRRDFNLRLRKRSQWDGLLPAYSKNQRGFEQTHYENKETWQILSQGLDGVTHLLDTTMYGISHDQQIALTQAGKDLGKHYQNKISHFQDTPEGFMLCLGWLNRLQPAFIDLLASNEAKSEASRNPQALLLVAYFCPLLQTLDHLWWMQGWAQHVYSGVRKHLLHAVQNMRMNEGETEHTFRIIELLDLPGTVLQLQQGRL